MKKVYEKPVAEVCEVELQGVIASVSGPGVSDQDAKEDGGAQSDDRASWGNLW